MSAPKNQSDVAVISLEAAYQASNSNAVYSNNNVLQQTSSEMCQSPQNFVYTPAKTPTTTTNNQQNALISNEFQQSSNTLIHHQQQQQHQINATNNQQNFSIPQTHSEVHTPAVYTYEPSQKLVIPQQQQHHQNYPKETPKLKSSLSRSNSAPGPEGSVQIMSNQLRLPFIPPQNQSVAFNFESNDANIRKAEPSESSSDSNRLTRNGSGQSEKDDPLRTDDSSNSQPSIELINEGCPPFPPIKSPRKDHPRKRKRKETKGDDTPKRKNPQRDSSRFVAQENASRTIPDYFRQPVKDSPHKSNEIEIINSSLSPRAGVNSALNEDNQSAAAGASSSDGANSNSVSTTALTPVNSNQNAGSCNMSPPKTTDSNNNNNNECVSHTLELEKLRLENDQLRVNMEKYKSMSEETGTKLTKCSEVQKTLLIELATMQRKNARTKLTHNRMRIGQYMGVRDNEFQDRFADGYAFTELNKKFEQLQLLRTEFENERKALQKKKQSVLGKRSDRDNDGTLSRSSTMIDIGSTDSNGETKNEQFVQPDYPRDMTAQDWYEQDEIIKLRLSNLKKQEQELNEEKEKLERERQLHCRELKRVANEDHSHFRDFPLLRENRYILLTLIGRGGFSEVYKAFDFIEQRYVGVKIHQLNREWREDKKANYMRHAQRELTIHRNLKHQRVVELIDFFELDVNTLVTVLEYVEGCDLDFYLKQQKTLVEREARTCILQVMSALKYFNEIKPPIIHYDLKPGNILMGIGKKYIDIKLTDFGLSKIMREDLMGDDGMDLTSQGAGTYWYLPPEVFETGRIPKVSSKVDVWSVGVIFYQCLYGCKPYGDKLSQRDLLHQRVILNAKEVQFPQKPAVSNEAKSFIRRCLERDAMRRPDVLSIATDPYLQSGPKSRGNMTTSNYPGPSVSFSSSSSYGVI